MPWRKQSRTMQARGTWMTRQRAEDQQLYNRRSMTSWAHCGSLSKRRELVLSRLPTPPPPLFFSPILGPRSQKLRLISLNLLSTCMYHTFIHITFLGYNHMNFKASVFSTHCYPNTSSDITCVLGEAAMARNLRQVHGLTLTRVRESTVVADFADVDMHAPPAFIMFMGSQAKEMRSFSSRE